MQLSLLRGLCAIESQLFTVECSLGKTISKALELGDARKPLVLTVKGTCNENVTIARDDVTVQGTSQNNGSLIALDPSQPVVTVRGARVLISRLSLVGGVTVIHSPDVIIDNTLIENAPQNGLTVLAGHVRLSNSVVQNSGRNGVNLNQSSAVLNNNQIRSNSSVGVYLQGKSAVQGSKNPIRLNGMDGVSLFGDSYANLQGTAIDFNGSNGVGVNSSRAKLYNGNTITNHPGAGVAVVLSTVSLSYSTLSGNETGASVYLGSNFVLIGGTVSQNRQWGVYLSANSTSQIGGATIQGNGAEGIWLVFGSRLMLVAPSSTVSGNGGYDLRCLDGESSVYDIAWLTGSVIDPSCTGF